MVGLSSLQMGNNLKYFIKLAGMTNAQVAAAKGIAPESVSRHCSGRSQMSIRDALDYAAILECAPEALLFDKPPLVCIGKMTNGQSVDLYDESERFEVSVSATFGPGTRLIERVWDDNNSSSYDGMFTVLDARPMKTNTVPQAAYGKPCIVSYDVVETRMGVEYKNKTEIGYFIVYPMPGNLYTLQAVYGRALHQSVSLNWACVSLASIQRPDLLGWQKVT